MGLGRRSLWHHDSIHLQDPNLLLTTAATALTAATGPATSAQGQVPATATATSAPPVYTTPSATTKATIAAYHTAVHRPSLDAGNASSGRQLRSVRAGGDPQ